ncbi:MAG: DNA polymerase III subunit chi [Burkholderiales bacterium]|nr:DNA polymerase III subunit chi [Burkholderiales bacterium]MDE2274707.1 DNA polymerase III subunit chi [Burkholderiales bacterium]
MAQTAVEFHTGIGDCAVYACRLLRKAYRRGTRLLLTAPPARLAEIDRGLWVLDERDFIPHLRLPAADAGRLARTPIWLAEHADAVDPAPALLVNVGAGAPARPAAFERLIEIVGLEPDEVERGRARWRAYRAAQLPVTHHVGLAARD